MNESSCLNVECRLWLDELLEIFPVLNADDFEIVPASSLPQPFKKLLDHQHHMTVTLEEHHGCPVHLNVVEVRHRENLYSRKLTLTAGPRGPVVMAGLMRFNLAVCDAAVRQRIIEQKTPLGRILIEHEVMRRIQLIALLRFNLRTEFGELFGIHDVAALDSPIVYGRLALIYCNDRPTVKLLEVVSPAER